jgi:hypothetical protein
MIRNLFVEYRGKGSGNERWSFNGVIRLERDYFIFARLAGIGGDVKDALVPPRGFPNDAAGAARDENFTCIDYAGKAINSSNCSPEDAARWVATGKSHYDGTLSKMALPISRKGEAEAELVDIRKPARVSNPDWHIHSWLSTDEFEKAIEKTARPIPPTYQATIAAMRSLEASGFEVRCVFWFDN